MNKLKVVEILGSLHRGGAETMVFNYFKAFDKTICSFDFVIHGRFENDYYDEVLSLGANVIQLQRPGELGFFKYVKSLTNELRKNGPYDVIHIHTNSQAFMAVIAAKKAGIKRIIVHSHSTKFNRFRLFINRLIFKIYHVRKLACGLEAGKKYYGNTNFEILNNAIDMEKFSSVVVPKDKEEYILGTIGRLVEVKNHFFLLEIMNDLKKYQRFKLLIYGEGSLKEKLHDKVLEYGLGDSVFLMGTTSDVPSAYASFDLFLLPSLYEGFPVTLVESQASKIPSIVSDKVSKECDFGLGLLTYVPLNKDIWEKIILKNATSKKARSFSKELFASKSKEFDVRYQWMKLFEIYNGQ